MTYHFSPIDVFMFNAAPLCGEKHWSGITTSREAVTCPACIKMLAELDAEDAKREPTHTELLEALADGG